MKTSLPACATLTDCTSCKQPCIRLGEKLYDRHPSQVLLQGDDGLWEAMEGHLEHECLEGLTAQLIESFG